MERQLLRARSTSDILAAVLRSEPDWSALPAETPPRIRKLLRRCLERDRKQRLRDIGEARIAIDAPEEEEVTARPAPSRRWKTVGGGRRSAGAIASVAGCQLPGGAPRNPSCNRSMRLTVELPPDDVLARGRNRRGPHVALSPDGTRLAVSVLGADGKVRLATRLLDQSQFTMLTGTEGANSLFSRPMANGSDFSRTASSEKIAVQGGVSLPLCDATPRGASWGTMAIS